MDLLILDTETTGLDPSKDRLIEVATALYSVDHRAVVKVRSWILQGETNEAESINRIPPALLKHPHVAMPELTDPWLSSWADGVTAIVAHGEFDRQWFGPQIQSRPWVDSCDLEWPRPSSSRSLAALALAHGVGVVSAHRALDDVMTLVRLFERAAEVGADVPAMIAKGLRPRARFVAEVSYDDRELAKEAGFRWEPQAKEWRRTMAIEDTAALPFAVREVA